MLNFNSDQSSHFTLGPRYTLEWFRYSGDGQSHANIPRFLTVPAEEANSLWGPGDHPWQINFKYDLAWAQRKMSPSVAILQRQRPLSRNKKTAEPIAQDIPDTPIRLMPGPVYVSMFWDHWRLTKLLSPDIHTSTATMEKERVQSGRSYGDAQAIDKSES